MPLAVLVVAQQALVQQAQARVLVRQALVLQAQARRVLVRQRQQAVRRL